MLAAPDRQLEGSSRQNPTFDCSRLHDPRAVANYFIKKVNNIDNTSRDICEVCEKITPLSLQKLTFISYALTLVDLDRQLTSEFPRVGKYDPYFPSIKESLSYYGGKTITRPIVEGTGEEVYFSTGEGMPISSQFDSDELEILDDVWQMFLNIGYDCTRLTYLTGGTSEEYREMISRFGIDNEISNEYIADITCRRIPDSDAPEFEPECEQTSKHNKHAA